MSEANKTQIGGDHYKVGGEEHWDRQWRLFGPGYFIGCITKYVERYQKKNGVEDLKKARHFLDKLIELETEANAKEYTIYHIFGVEVAAHNFDEAMRKYEEFCGPNGEYVNQ